MKCQVSSNKQRLILPSTDGRYSKTSSSDLPNSEFDSVGDCMYRLHCNSTTDIDSNVATKDCGDCTHKHGHNHEEKVADHNKKQRYGSSEVDDTEHENDR